VVVAEIGDPHLRAARRRARRRLAHCRAGARLGEWVAAHGKRLTTIYATHGHERPGNDDDPRILEETRQYIRDFDRLAETTTTARELYDQMLALYPDRINPGALWSSARACKPEEGTA
jgi:hypothetical protein